MRDIVRFLAASWRPSLSPIAPIEVTDNLVYALVPLSPSLLCKWPFKVKIKSIFYETIPEDRRECWIFQVKDLIGCNHYGSDDSQTVSDLGMLKTTSS